MKKYPPYMWEVYTSLKGFWQFEEASWESFFFSFEKLHLVIFLPWIILTTRDTIFLIL